VAWIVGRRRVQVEVENQVLKNLELSISLYKDIIDSLKKEIHDLNIKIQDLENKIEELIKENHELKGYGKGL
jgi:prefoldin subunit 5